MPDKTDSHQVYLCRAWIDWFAIHATKIQRKHSSYYYKHRVEEYFDTYISNESFIEAARLEGLKIESDGPNAYFDFTPMSCTVLLKRCPSCGHNEGRRAYAHLVYCSMCGERHKPADSVPLAIADKNSQEYWRMRKWLGIHISDVRLALLRSSDPSAFP